MGRMVEDRPIISNSDCNAVYGIVGDGVVCIDTTGGKGTCNGDSGGPLNMMGSMKGAGDKWKQVGVVSFGASAGCEVGYPAGFTWTGSAPRLTESAARRSPILPSPPVCCCKILFVVFQIILRKKIQIKRWT